MTISTPVTGGAIEVARDPPIALVVLVLSEFIWLSAVCIGADEFNMGISLVAIAVEENDVLVVVIVVAWLGAV